MKLNEPARKSFNKYGKGRCQHFWDTIFKDVDKAVNGMAVFDTLGWPRSAPPMPKQDIKRLQLLHLLAENPRRSQRELSRHMGVALGSVNYCLSGLIDKGYIKLENFRRADNRLAYAYNLTPDGIETKLHLTYRFLKLRLKEYTEIKEQIQTLSTELADQNPELLSDLDFKDILSLSPER